VNLGATAIKMLKGSRAQRGDQRRVYSQSQMEKRKKKSAERRQMKNNAGNAANATNVRNVKGVTIQMTGGPGRGAGQSGRRQPSRMMPGLEQYDPFEEFFEETPKPMRAGFRAGMSMGCGMERGISGFDQPSPYGGRRPMPYGEMDDAMDLMPVGLRRPRSMLDRASMLEEPMLPPRGLRHPLPPRRLTDPYGPQPGMSSFMDPLRPPPLGYIEDPYYEDSYFGGLPLPPRGALMATRRRSAPGGVHPHMRHADMKRGNAGDGRPANRPVIKPKKQPLEDSLYSNWKKKEGEKLGGAAMKILKGSKKQRGDKPRVYSKSQMEKRKKNSEKRRQLMNNPRSVMNRKLFKLMLNEFFFFGPLSALEEEKEKQKEEQDEKEVSPELAEDLAQARQQVLVTEMDTW